MYFFPTGKLSKQQFSPSHKSEGSRTAVYFGQQRGLSLVELLVVISVLGFLSAIAIPIVSNIFNRAEVAAAQQTARQIAQAAVAATATGNTDIIDANNLDEAIDAIRDGLTITIGTGSSEYGIGTISDENVLKAKDYLEYQSNTIIFCPSGARHHGSGGGLGNGLSEPSFSSSSLNNGGSS